MQRKSAGPVRGAGRAEQSDHGSGLPVGHVSAVVRVRPQTPRPGTDSAGPRVAFLDGIRGLASLYVVLYHLLRLPGSPPEISVLTAPFRHGPLAVAVFIVLSGYVLMLPVARSADGHLRDGFVGYMRRRARRILPPYYAALVLAFSLGVAVQAASPGASRDPGLSDPGNLVAHALLLHNLRRDWAQSINPPLWSVATEWQLYFLFALVLIPLWRRLGAWAAVLVGLALGLAPYAAHGLRAELEPARFWYLGLFAMGMWAASARHSERRATAWFLASAAAAGAAALASAALPLGMPRRVVADAFTGAAAALLIASCANATSSSCARALLVRVLEWRPVVWLGTVSYSVYLVHLPLAWVIGYPLRRLHIDPVAALALRALVLVPMVLAACWLFYLAFERPYTHLARRRRPEGSVHLTSA